MNPLADNVVKLYQTFDIMGFDIHEGIDAVVGFCISGKNIFYLIAVLEKAVYPFLKHGIAQNAFFSGSVTGVENTDTFSEPSVEAVRPRIQHLEYFYRASQAVQQ